MSKILLIYEDYSELMSAEASLKKVGFDVLGLTNEYSLGEHLLAFNPDAVVGSGRGQKVSSSVIGKKMKEMTRWQGHVILNYDAKTKPTAQELIKMRADIVLENPVPPARLIQVIARLLKLDDVALLEKFNKVLQVDTSNTDSVRVSGGEERSQSLFGRLRQAPDLYADETPRSAKTTEGAFSDVDINSIEFEIKGQGKSEKKAEPAFTLKNDESKVESHLALKDELKKVQSGEADRVARYGALIEDLVVPATSTVTRVDARRRQNDLQKDMDQNKLKSIDELRREFTKALFKK